MSDTAEKTETIETLGVPRGNGKHLLKWRKALGIGQVELADASGVSQTLVSFIENETETFTEAAKGKLWGAIMRLGFDRVKKNGNLQEWAQMLLTVNAVEEKRRAERTEQWEKIQAEQARRQDTIFGSLLLPEEESEMQRIIAEGEASLELSKLIIEQVKELSRTALPHEKKAQLAYIRKNPEKVWQEFRELFGWQREVCEWWPGFKEKVEAEIAAKDARIAELEQELRALKEKE